MFVHTAGRIAQRDPYYRDLVRINIDTGAITTLVDSDHDYYVASSKNRGFHLTLGVKGSSIKNANGVAPSGDYAVVVRTRADEVSVSVLLNRNGGEVLTLETTDLYGLPDSWRWPEAVKTLSADGETDIYGLIFKPSNFDPERSYPVISFVVNIPECFVQKGSFDAASHLNWLYLEAAALAELGFIVVTMDGRGTPWRSKAVQDESYGSYHDCSHLDDHVAGIKQLAQRDPSMDLNRVGIHSSLGTSACLIGLLRYPDFYRVGTNVGCFQDSRLMPAPMITEKYEGLASSNFELFESQVNQLKGKLLLSHGMLNPEFPVAGTFRLVEQLMRANKDFDMLILPSMGHDLLPDYLTRRVWDYLVTHLMGAAPPKEFNMQLVDAQAIEGF